jgi:hypothetical protein
MATTTAAARPAAKLDPLQRVALSLLEMPEPFADVMLTFEDSEPPLLANRFMLGAASIAIAADLKGKPTTEVAHVHVRFARKIFDRFVEYVYTGEIDCGAATEKANSLVLLEMASALSSESLLALCKRTIFGEDAQQVTELAGSRLVRFLIGLAENPVFADATLIVRTAKGRLLASVPCHRAMLSLFSWRLRPMIAAVYEKVRYGDPTAATTPTMSPIVVRCEDEAQVQTKSPTVMMAS